MRKTSALLVLVLLWAGTTTDRHRQASGQVAAVARATNCLEILVRTARDEQPDLQTQEEHCSADADLLAHIGRAKGHQVRIYKNPTAYGLYTVSELRSEDSNTIVRMGCVGRKRLGTEDVFSGIISAQVPHPDLDEREAEKQGEFVERLDDDGENTGLIVIAPHGGAIEPNTDEQAERVTSELKGRTVSSWRCKGWSKNPNNSAYQRWHITSAEIHEASFPKLAGIINRRFTHAVSFHGFNRENFPRLDADVLIGGGLDDGTLKAELKDTIQKALEGTGLQVRVARTGDPLNGEEPRNVVNRLAKRGGIQIEQSKEARRHWERIAQAVAEVYRSKL
jgi:phage replication-related protein YjqB (UPF0714/DUF867 family)